MIRATTGPQGETLYLVDREQLRTVLCDSLRAALAIEIPKAVRTVRRAQLESLVRRCSARSDRILKAVGPHSDFRTVRGIASTNDVDRRGDRILSWSIAAGIPVLVNHDWDRPVGEVVWAFDRGSVLEVELCLLSGLPEASAVSAGIDDGTMCGLSVHGASPEAAPANKWGGHDLRDFHVFEVSVVPTGNQANPAARLLDGVR